MYNIEKNIGIVFLSGLLNTLFYILYVMFVNLPGGVVGMIPLALGVISVIAAVISVLIILLLRLKIKSNLYLTLLIYHLIYFILLFYFEGNIDVFPFQLDNYDLMMCLIPLMVWLSLLGIFKLNSKRLKTQKNLL